MKEGVIKIRYFNSQCQQEIQIPLISLIMEAFRLEDERESLELKKQTEQKPRLQFIHMSTIDKTISLDIGAQLKMEFTTPETSLMSMVVGMIENKYLLVTTPSPFSVVQEALDSGNRIVVRFIRMGKLFMFKTTLLKTIDDPHDPHGLLFLSYPPVIHHHEFRSAKRTATFIPCTLKLDGSVEYRGALLDMSSKGALFQIKAKGRQSMLDVVLDDHIQLRFLLPGFNEEQNINGLVKNFKKDHVETRIGVEFTQVQNNVREKIKSYLYSIEILHN